MLVSSYMVCVDHTEVEAGSRHHHTETHVVRVQQQLKVQAIKILTRVAKIETF